MSLFQVREWWSTTTTEEYSYGGLVVGNVDNSSAGHAKIVTGSLSGMLRVYHPTNTEFKIEHQLLEENLGKPILQLELGYFLPNARALALAVLHPRCLAVYTIDGVGGDGAAASYFNVALRYEHRLGIDGAHFTAFNMISGAFGSGGAASASRYGDVRDHLCVQSLDGRLQFFEQDRFAFLQPVDSNLLPGALCYAAGTDAIVVATSDLQIACYRYQVLASASLKKKKNTSLEAEQDTASSVASKQLHCDWLVNVGEPILEIRVARCFPQDSSTSFDLLALGEFTLFGVKPHGEIFMQKRLGFHPSTFCLFRRPPEPPSGGSRATPQTGPLANLLVASHSKLWSVFKDRALLWSAWAPSVSVAMHVAEFGGIPGLIVNLTAEGLISVNYMGTDPPSTSVVAPDTKEINYEDMDEEHRQLLQVIRRAQGERRTEPKERVLVRAQVPVLLDAVGSSEAHGRDKFHHHQQQQQQQPLQAHEQQLTMRVYVTFTGATMVSNVTLSITTPENVLASESSLVLDSVDGRTSTPLIVPIRLWPNGSVMPTSLDVVVSAAYTLETGQPRVSQCRVQLPLALCCRVVPPVKASTFKFTLETDQEPVELASLFADMFQQPQCSPDWMRQVMGGGGSGGTNVLSFQYANGVEATILVSKNAGRYRIQANELEALWLVASELVRRLRLHFQPDSSSSSSNADHKESKTSNDSVGVEVFYQEPLPLADFFGMIDQHFALRKEKMALSAEMNDRAHQFRVIQKRLLVRYKDRTPAAIHCLDTLLHGTHDQLLALSHRMDAVTAQLTVASNRLSCCVRLMLMLITFRFQLNDENARVLASYLSPQVDSDAVLADPVTGEGGGGAIDGQGWEERTDAAMTELLRTLLSKQQQQQQQQPAQVPVKEGAAAPVLPTYDLSFPEDTKKLKKHITIVCDRLGKGATLVPSSNSSHGAMPAREAEHAKGGDHAAERKGNGAK